MDPEGTKFIFISPRLLQSVPFKEQEYDGHNPHIDDFYWSVSSTRLTEI